MNRRSFIALLPGLTLLKLHTRKPQLSDPVIITHNGVAIAVEGNLNKVRLTRTRDGIVGISCAEGSRAYTVKPMIGMTEWQHAGPVLKQAGAG